MSVVKEWNCATHGPFECSDPICPAPGCRSQEVVREFRTPPGVRSRMVKQHDAGIRGLSERMGGVNFRSAQEGQASFGGDKAGGVLWGNDAAKFLGKPIGDGGREAFAHAAPVRDLINKDFSERNMRPPTSETLVTASDPADRKKVAQA